MTGAPTVAIGVATVGAGVIRLRARAHVAARRITGSAGLVLALALPDLGIELADDHCPDRVPGGTPGIMTAVGPDRTPGGIRGNVADASPLRVVDRGPDRTPGGIRGNTVMPGSHGPDRTPGGIRGNMTDRVTIAIGDGETHGVEVHGSRHRPAKSARFRGPENDCA